MQFPASPQGSTAIQPYQSDASRAPESTVFMGLLTCGYSNKDTSQLPLPVSRISFCFGHHCSFATSCTFRIVTHSHVPHALTPVHTTTHTHAHTRTHTHTHTHTRTHTQTQTQTQTHTHTHKPITTHISSLAKSQTSTQPQGLPQLPKCKQLSVPPNQQGTQRMPECVTTLVGTTHTTHPTTHKHHTLYHRQLHSLPLPMPVPLAAPVALPLHRLPSNPPLTGACITCASHSFTLHK
jgi:hypothetical protein